MDNSCEFSVLLYNMAVTEVIILLRQVLQMFPRYDCYQILDACCLLE